MRDYLAHEVRNVVVLGHSGVGKTAVLESMLYFTKASDRFGKTKDGSSLIDYDAEEIRRGISVYASLVPIEWKENKINFIDTPGYLDFVGESEAGLAVGDNALIVVGAKEGVERRRHGKKRRPESCRRFFSSIKPMKSMRLSKAHMKPCERNLERALSRLKFLL